MNQRYQKYIENSSKAGSGVIIVEIDKETTGHGFIKVLNNGSGIKKEKHASLGQYQDAFLTVVLGTQAF